jgi:hypothetical protein
MKPSTPSRMRISDKQWVLLLAGGLFFMLGGSWFSQFEPDRRHRAQMRHSQEMPFQLDPSGTASCACCLCGCQTQRTQAIQ